MVAFAVLATTFAPPMQNAEPLPPIRLPLPIEKPFVPEGKPLEGLVITLDAGHGGSSHTAGYSGSARGVVSRVVEQDLNMLVSAHLFHHLQAAGAKVYLTRRDDRRVTLNPLEGEPTGRDQELGARVDVAKLSRSHLFLALHHNSASRPTAHGVVILIWPKDNAGADQPLERAFADVLREEVEKAVPHAERFNHYLSEHPLVTFSDIPSAVVEFGFLSNPEFDRWVSQPGSHRAEAIGVYRAIERFWGEKRAELERERDRVFAAKGKPVERPIAKPDPTTQVARSLWTRRTKIADETNAAWFLDQYRRTTLSDRTLFHFNVRAKRSGGTWTVSGSVNHPLLGAFAPQLLSKAVGRPVESTIRVLPDGSFGHDPYAIVSIPMALTWGEPREGADVQTQALLGEPLFLLDRSEDGAFYLAHTADGYLGWIRRDALALVSKQEFRAWSERPMARATSDVLVDDFRIPAGAWLPLLDHPSLSKVRVSLPRGVRGTGGEAFTTVDSSRLRLPSASNLGRTAAQAAAEFLGVPYVFGGRSRLGLDCSGLTGVAWAASGLTLPRDTRQQILVGRLVATSWHREGLKPGDLLFFIDETGRVVHAGISIGGTRFLHAMPPEVQVSSLDSADPVYSKTWSDAFAFARRLSE